MTPVDPELTRKAPALPAPSDTTLLLIEDDRQIQRILLRRLERQGYRVFATGLARHGLLEVARRQADLVLLDLNLPDMDGVAVIRDIRGWSQVPVIVLSSRDDDPDRIAALNAGADDFIGKPFSLAELEARIRAALRRTEPHAGEPAGVDANGLYIDFARRVVRVHGQAVHLSPIEFRLLWVLVRNIERITTHREILIAVWGPTQVHDAHHLRVHMSMLRKKIEADPMHPRYIVTEPTIGYRFTLGPDHG